MYSYLGFNELKSMRKNLKKIAKIKMNLAMNEQLKINYDALDIDTLIDLYYEIILIKKEISDEYLDLSISMLRKFFLYYSISGDYMKVLPSKFNNYVEVEDFEEILHDVLISCKKDFWVSYESDLNIYNRYDLDAESPFFDYALTIKSIIDEYCEDLSRDMAIDGEDEEYIEDRIENERVNYFENTDEEGYLIAMEDISADERIIEFLFEVFNGDFDDSSCEEIISGVGKKYLVFTIRGIYAYEMISIDVLNMFLMMIYRTEKNKNINEKKICV